MLGACSAASRDLAIDMGTANTVIFAQGRGVVADEPSVIVLDARNRVEAVGREALAMVGRTPGGLLAIHPIRQGVIAEFDAAERMLASLLGRVCAGSRLASPRMVVCGRARRGGQPCRGPFPVGRARGR